jgi:homoserine acetyltransferase
MHLRQRQAVGGNRQGQDWRVRRVDLAVDRRRWQVIRQQAVGGIKAKTLFLPASGDLLLPPAFSQHSADAMKKAGNTPQYAEIPGNWGHLDGLVNIQSVAPLIETFPNPP